MPGGRPEKKAGDSTPDVNESRVTEATGAKNSSRLVPGATYSGTVTARQADGTYSVEITSPSMTLTGVLLAAPVMGGYLGLSVKCNLPQLTKVKLVHGNPAFIYAVMPEKIKDAKTDTTRSLLWGPNMDKEQGVTANSMSNHAEDLLEGEVEFANLHGVSVEFLTTLMRMKAGDRAAVECHLINDMVRVISSQFKHISGLGEDLIYDHGRPTMERNWSMYRHEVHGAEKEKEQFVEMNGDEADREDLEAQRVNGLGRSRFREFVGFAGDFIHSFVTDPPAMIAALVKDGSDPAHAAGKSWFHRNSDGSVLLQSVADIRLERVCRIPVPVRIAHHEDPAVTKERGYDELEAAFLKLPKVVSPLEPTDAFHMAYHIRSYARWLGRYHSFARMLQLQDEYKIPTEDESPEPSWTNAEDDRDDQNARTTYYDAYACISILRDGSIVNHDAYGSSIVMSNGNVQVSASRHLDLEAAGDIRMIAGGSVLVKARRNIELSAVMGGLILHSYAWFKVLCEKGSVWLRSNATTGKDEEDPEPKEEGAPIPEIAGRQEGEHGGFGVLIESVDGSSAYRSHKGTTISVDGSTTEEEDEEYNLTITTSADLDVYGRRSAALHSSGSVSIGSGSDLLISSTAILANTSEFLLGGNMAAPSVVVRNNTLWCGALESETVSSNLILGPERSFSIPTPDASPRLPLKRHFNHINVILSPVERPDGATEEQLEAASGAAGLASQNPTLPWGSASAGPQWAFPEKDEYIWDDRESVDSCVPETLTQQHLRLDFTTTDPEGDGEDRWGGIGYAAWELSNTIAGKRTDSAGGFGTYEQQLVADDYGEPLGVPSANDPGETDSSQNKFSEIETSWRPKSSFNVKALKREGEA